MNLLPILLSDLVAAYDHFSIEKHTFYYIIILIICFQAMQKP